MPIQQLAPDVAAKIAAGEVVERPASVVKELIENSIDAGATQIRVDLTNGGLQLIRVTDNGTGIAADELPLALSRHATSKVQRIDDLEQIRSLGFRGEALASIAAVAEVSLLSRPASAEQGAQITATNGTLSEVTVAASPAGTTLTVRNLFSAVPARLKFLKSRNTEVGHCHHLLEQYALAYPEIRFSVFSDGRQIFATPGDGQLSSVLVEVYGLQVAEQMIPIQNSEHADDPEYPRVSGYVSRPTCYKSTRQHISFFVNRRWVLSRMLTSAVDGAYHSLLLNNRHPIAVINIQIDPALLDVNVHPAKTEIRFLKERRVFSAILHTVRNALLVEPEMPEWQPQQKTPLASVEQIDEKEPQTSVNDSDPVSHDNDEAAATFPQDNPWLTVTEEETGTRPPLLSRLWQSHVRVQSANTSADEKAAARFSVPALPPSEPVELPLSEPSDSFDSFDSFNSFDSSDSPESAPSEAFRLPPPPMRRVPDAPQPETIAVSSSPDEAARALTAGTTIDPAQTRRLPRLRVVGQLSQSYIVTEGEDGMYLIDQHAAHERILLERMVASLKVHTPLSQHLLTPMQLSLTPDELEAIEDHQQSLTHIGFSLEITDSKTLEVLAVPNVLVKQMNARSLHELLIELTSPENLGHTETWEERALANVACKAAIKQNYFLTVSEMREMLEQLEQTKAPYSCCHGRPTMVHFSLSALEREFGRR
jgi:DNA mismatch repair protein MutL